MPKTIHRNYWVYRYRDLPNEGKEVALQSIRTSLGTVEKLHQLRNDGNPKLADIKNHVYSNHGFIQRLYSEESVFWFEEDGEIDDICGEEGSSFFPSPRLKTITVTLYRFNELPPESLEQATRQKKEFLVVLKRTADPSLSLSQINGLADILWFEKNGAISRYTKYMNQGTPL